MKEANFLKRLSAITLAAAITAANVGFDFLPTAKKADIGQKEEKSVIEVKTPEVMTQKSKYPTSLSFIVEQNENGESVLRASSPKVFNRYFTAELVSLDPPAEGEEPEQLEFSADGTVIRKGGNYSVNVRTKVDEEMGELLYNPYTIVSGSISIAEEEAVPEAETVPQEIAVIEESEPVEETAAEEITAEQAEPAEVPVITETSVVICESDINAAFGLFDMSQSRKLDYTVVKSQDSYNVMIPDDYDQLFFNGIDEEGNAFFNAAGEEVQVNFNEVEMNIQIVNFAELKIKDIAEPDEYSINRFCGEETLPYYYGEIMKVTPADGYNIVIGDMKYSDAVSVAVNDDTPEAELAEVKVFEKNNDGNEVISENFEIDINEENTIATVKPAEGKLNGMKYTLSVARENQEPLICNGEPLSINIGEAVINEDGIIHVEASGITDAKYLGVISAEKIEKGFEAADSLGGRAINEFGANESWSDKPFRDADGYFLPFLRLPKDGVMIKEFYIVNKNGDKLAVYDKDGKLINSTITNKDAFLATDGIGEYMSFPLNSDHIHEDIYFDVDFDSVKTICLSFDLDKDSPYTGNQDDLIDPRLNGKEFNSSSLNDNDDDNIVSFKIKNSYVNQWEISKVKYNNQFVDANGYSIGKTNVIKDNDKFNFTITVVEKTIQISFTADKDSEYTTTRWIKLKSKREAESWIFSNQDKNVQVKPGNITFEVYSSPDFYVRSIRRAGEIIYNADPNDKTDYSEFTEFNVNGNGEVTIKENNYTKDVTFVINYEKVTDAGNEVEAIIAATNYKQEDDNKNAFSILDDSYKVSFQNENGDFLPFCNELNGVSETIESSCGKRNLTKFTLNTNSDEIKNKENKVLTYYVADGNVIKRVILNINKATTEPKITGFKIEKNPSPGEKILNILTFGIFSNDEKLTLTVYAMDEANNGLKISDIKIYDNGFDNELTDGVLTPNEEDGTAYKTYTLEQGKQYNLTAQAFTKFDPNNKEETEKPTREQSKVFVINVKGNQLDVIESDVEAVNQIPVIIESNAPTITLQDSGKLWYGKEGVDITVNAQDYVNSTDDEIHSGIDRIEYQIIDSKSNNEVSNGKFTCPKDKKYSDCNLTNENGIHVNYEEDAVIHRTITATAYDNAGNSGNTDINGKEASLIVAIDGKAPKIGDVKAYTEDDKPYNGGWTNKPVTIKFPVTDDGSGVDVETVKANGNVVGVDSDGVYHYTVEGNFAGDIALTANDLVGNPADTKPTRIQTESYAPTIDLFEILAENDYDKTISKEDLTNSFNAETFQYYFDVNAIVKVSANDISEFENLNSGVSEIKFAQIPSNEIPFENDITKYIVDSRVTDGYAEFPVNAGFEGTFAIQVVDNAGNESKWYTPEMLIAENPAAHGDHAHAEIILPQTPYSNNGIPLYAEVPNVTFYVEDTASGIDSITYSISTKGNVKETKNYPVGDLKDKTTKINVTTSGTGEIKLSDYEENNITINLTAKDNAGNIITATSKTISIDKTAPKIISIKFNPEGSANQEFFNKQRTATVRAKDSNFNTANLNDLIDVAVTNALGTSAAPYKITKTWEKVNAVVGDEIKGDEEVYECVITFVQDAEYTFSISVEDLTKKSAKSEVNKFIIDTTAPKLSISFDNNSKANDKYYNAGRKATLTINEHNFEKNKDSVKSVLSAKDADGITVMDSKEIYDGKLTWTQSSVNKDEWTAQINFNKEGTFNFSMAYTDPAGNNGNDAGSGEFVIDTTAPKIEQTFTKSGNKLATNGDLIPHVTFSDYNFLSENQIGNNCQVNIRKIGENGLSSESFSATSRTYTSKKEKSPVTFEQIFDIFDKKVEVDGIYEISIKAEDLAGNVTEKNDLTVSINRFGSTYMIVNDEARKAVEMYAANGTPIKDNIEFEIAEVNVTPSKGKRIVKVNVDGTSINELKDGFKISESRVSLEDDSWESNENGWYQTVYKIDKKNFENDGVYTITLASEDEAGNPNFSDDAIAPRANLETTFAVDTTVPTVIIAGADKYEYKESSIELTITCMDRNLYDIDELNFDPNNEEKSSFYMKINGENHNISSLKSQLGADISNDEAGNIVIKLPVKGSGNNSKQNVDVLIMDKAGNSSIESAEFVLSVTNNWLMIIVIAASVLVLGTAVFFITKKVRNR